MTGVSTSIERPADSVAEDDDSKHNESRGGVGIPGPRADVFVSYRVSSDQRIAGALKRLIESSIDPPPVVFVSGIGGVRPSAIGFKPQIQRAAQEARAFVGIITQLSKDREWIFYEAGAAWGRGQVYAPLLVDVSPNELPTTIADYHAVRAGELGDMQLLIESIATALSAEARPYFSRRYQAFSRSITAEPLDPEPPAEPPETSNEVFESHLSFARLQAYSGERERARVLLDALIAKAPSNEARADAEISKIRVLIPPEERLVALDGVSPEIKSSRAFHYWAAVWEASLRPHVAIFHWDALLKLNPPDPARAYATVQIARLNYATGRELVAWKLLRRALTHDARSLRARAAAAFCELFVDTPAIERLLVLISSLSIPDVEILRAGVELSRTENWVAIIAYFLKRVSVVDNEYSHERAMSLATMGLRSLAFEAYMEGVSKGTAVSKAAAAALVGRHSNPAAGLRILRDHVGAFPDAKYPNYPHEVRGELEKKIYEEHERLERAENAGERIFHAISEFMHVVLADDSNPVVVGKFEHDGEPYTLHILTADAYLLISDGATGAVTSKRLEKLKLLNGVWQISEGDKLVGLLCAKPNGDLWGIGLGSLSEEAPTCRWTLFSRRGD